MHRFWDSVIEPALTCIDPRVVIEIGASTGLHTRHLIDFCRPRGAVLHVIDPVPRFDVAGWQKEYGDQLVVHQAKSLEALPQIEPAGAVLIDGDHNWYTVFHELRQLQDVASEHKRDFPLVMLHDISWPYGRRDLYYNPNDIPEKFRNSHERAAIEPGCNGLTGPSGFNWHLYNATDEGGPRNGVATAIDDFLASGESSAEYLRVPGFHGLGILVPHDLMEGPLRTFLASVTPSAALASHIDALEASRVAAEVNLKKVTDRGRTRSAEFVSKNNQSIVDGGLRHGQEESTGGAGAATAAAG